MSVRDMFIFPWLLETAQSACHKIIENIGTQLLHHQRAVTNVTECRKWISFSFHSQLLPPRSSVTYRRKIALAISIRFAPTLSWFCPPASCGRKYRFSSMSPKHCNCLATCRHRVFICSVSSTFVSTPFGSPQRASAIVTEMKSELIVTATDVVGSLDNGPEKK